MGREDLQSKAAAPGPLHLLPERTTAQDQNQQDSPIHSLVSTWEPCRGFQDVEGSSFQAVFVNDVSVLGVRNLIVSPPGLGELTVNTTVQKYFLNHLECSLCALFSRGNQAGYTPVITCWLHGNYFLL